MKQMFQNSCIWYIFAYTNHPDHYSRWQAKWITLIISLQGGWIYQAASEQGALGDRVWWCWKWTRATVTRSDLGSRHLWNGMWSVPSMQQLSVRGRSMSGSWQSHGQVLVVVCCSRIIHPSTLHLFIYCTGLKNMTNNSGLQIPLLLTNRASAGKTSLTHWG